MRSRLKYHNQPQVIDNVWFASKKEANRYLELQLLVRSGQIVDLVLQPRFPLVIQGTDGQEHHIGTYVADFAYTWKESGERVVEDTKGTMRRDFLLKWKLYNALYTPKLTVL